MTHQRKSQYSKLFRLAWECGLITWDELSQELDRLDGWKYV